MDKRDLEILNFAGNIEEIKESEGFKIYQIISSLRISKYIFKENQIILQKSIYEFYINEKLIEGNSVKRWHKQRSIIRNFHNVIASAQSFIEHCEKIKRRTGIESDLEVYLKNEITNNSIYLFFKVIRNYIIHTDIFPLISRLTIYEHKKKVFKGYKTIDKDDILEYIEVIIERTKNKKNLEDFKQVKKYIEELPSDFDITKLLNEYGTKIDNLYSWIIRKTICANNTIIDLLFSDLLNLQKYADEHGFRKDLPINEIQYRYLKFLYNISE